jgi:hypothetical protein
MSSIILDRDVVNVFAFLVRPDASWHRRSSLDLSYDTLTCGQPSIASYGTCLNGKRPFCISIGWMFQLTATKKKDERWGLERVASRRPSVSFFCSRT